MSILEEQEEIQDPEDFEPYQESSWVRFIEYLQTPQGDGRLGQAIEIYKESSLRNLDATKSNIIFVRLTQAILLLVVIIAASILAYCDKFNPTISLLFGTVVGYFFGKK
jgi:hypothetical protein